MIQGTSIAAAYDSESAYAKGDYCVKDGLLYKASVDIESPEAWNEDHWSAVNIMTQVVNTSQVGEPNGVATLDENGRLPEEQLTPITGENIPTSASDPTSISSQLSNKVSVTFPSPTSLDALLALRNAFSAVIPPATDMPYLDYWNCIVWSDTRESTEEYYSRVVYASPANKNDLWKLVVTNGSKFSWVRLTDNTPPQVRNLTLQSGFTADGDCTFFITQESEVFLTGGASGTLAANQDTQIGTLPADACPAAQRRRPAVTNAGPAYIDIHTDGTVWAHPFAAASQCWFDCSFVAGGGL